MGCEIIDEAVLKVNGGDGAYGGTCTSMSFSFGGLSSGMRASITLSGKELSTPQQGDAMGLTMFGEGFNMDVASYTKSKSKDSSTLSINLVDQSHKVLDQNFIKITDGTGVGTKGLITIGTKRSARYGNLGGSLVLAANTVFRKSNNKNEPGIPVAYGKVDPYGGKTVQEALASVYSGPIPDGPWKHEGSFREVIAKIASELGVLAYWDVFTNTVKVADATNFSKGENQLLDIASKCGGNVSISETEDFSVTEGRIAYGNIDTNADFQSDQQAVGGSMSRYFKAQLLDPDFHYGACGKAGSTNLLDFENPETLKAIYSSANPKAYGLYAMQSCINIGAIPEKGEKAAKLPGRGGSGEVDLSYDGNFTLNEDHGFTQNSIIRKYYEGSEGACKPQIFAVKMTYNTVTQSAIAQAIKDSAEKDKSKTGSLATKKAEEFKDGQFVNTSVILQDTDHFTSVMNKSGGIDASSDVFYKYLNIISKFKRQYYVIRGRSERAPTYRGFLLTNESQGATSRLEIPDGYDPISFNPWLAASDCGNQELIDMLKILTFIYKGESLCTRTDRINDSTGEVDHSLADQNLGFLSQVTMGSFIYAMYSNTLPDFFGGGGEEFGPEAKEENAKKSGQGLVMHLIKKGGSKVIDHFASFQSGECNDDGEISALTAGGEVPAMADENETLSLNIPLGEYLKDNDLNIITASAENADDHMIAAVPESAPRIVKCWYDVKTWPFPAGSSNETAQKYHAMADGSEEEVWKKSFSSFSVNPSDVSSPEDEAGSYASTFDNAADTMWGSVWTDMVARLEDIVGANIWADTITSKSSSISFSTDEEGFASMPSFESGVESVSMSVSGGKTNVTISSGNSRLKESIRTMRQAIAQAATRGKPPPGLVPNPVEGAPNPMFSQLARGGR